MDGSVVLICVERVDCEDAGFGPGSGRREQ